MNHFVWKGKNLFVSTKGRFLSESLMRLKKICQITILSRKFEFPTHKAKLFKESKFPGFCCHFNLPIVKLQGQL